MSESLYSLHAQRDYPIDDAASAIDDAGVAMPTNILLDCSLRFPETLGVAAFVSAVTITPTLVTILFEASNRHVRPSVLDGTPPTPVFTPLGGISLRPPFSTGTTIPIVADQPGVGGWVVLGTGVRQPYQGRFSSVAQSGLTLRSARPYRLLPVRTLGRADASSTMSGTITLTPGTDLAIESQNVTIGPLTVPAIGFRLHSESTASDPLERYTGPCGGRPESGTCDPPPIEQINAAVPDAAGNIEVVFQEGVVFPFANQTGGIAIDIPVTPPDFCNRDFDYDPDNPMPWDRPEDQCADNTKFSADPPQFDIDSGLFSSGPAGFTAYKADVLSVAVKTRTPAPKTIASLFQLPTHPEENVCNGGVVFGYHTNDVSQIVYYLALVDLNAEELAIYLVTNRVPIKLVSAPLQLTTTYRTNTDVPAVVELVANFGDGTADAIRETPPDQKIRVTIEVRGTMVSGRLAYDDVTTLGGSYGVGSLYSNTLFKEIRAED